MSSPVHTYQPRSLPIPPELFPIITTQGVGRLISVIGKMDVSSYWSPIQSYRIYHGCIGDMNFMWEYSSGRPQHIYVTSRDDPSDLRTILRIWSQHSGEVPSENAQICVLPDISHGRISRS